MGATVGSGTGGHKSGGCDAAIECTAVLTEAGGVLTFGDDSYEKLGHGTDTQELVPRVVEALAWKSVVGVSAGRGFETAGHTDVWTVQGALLTWGSGPGLGHGGPEDQHML